MAETYKSPFGDNNPYGLRRRQKQGPYLEFDETAPPQSDPQKGDWVAETARSVAANFRNDANAGLRTLGNALIGDKEGARQAAEEYAQRAERARLLGPRIQSFDDAEAAGGGVGDYAAALGYMAAGMAPDVVSVASGIGAGQVAGRAVARGVVRRSVADAIERRADNVAARMADTRVAREQARQAAVNAPGGAEAVSNAARVAQAQVNEASRKAAMKEAARIAGRTPRTGINPFQETVNTAGRWTGRALGTAAGVPRANSGNAEILAEEGTTQGDAAAILAGNVAGAALGILPLERLAGRFGKDAALEIARKGERFLPRVAKEFGKQGLAEGSQEVAQTATQLASHAYVRENPELLYDDNAWNQYVASFGAGFVLGGALGSGAEVGRTGADVTQRLARRAFTSAQDAFRAGVAKYQQRRAAAQPDRPRPGEEIPTDAAETGLGLPELFARNLRSLGDTVGAMGKGVADRFRKTEGDVQNDEIVESTLAGFEQGGQWEIPGLQRSPEQNPIEFKSPLQARLMAYVSDASPLWQDKDVARRVAKSLERLFGDRAKSNKVSDADMAIYDWLVDSGAMPRQTMVAMKGIGHIYAGLDKEATALDQGVGDDTPDTAMGQAMRAALDARRTDAAARDAEMADRGADESERALEAEGDAVNATLTETSGPDKPLPLRDQQANLRRAVIEANKRAKAAKTPEARQHIIDTERAPIDRQLKRVSMAMREKIFGPKGDPRGRDPLKYQYGRNVFDENKKAGNFDQVLKDPGRVELVQKGAFVKRDGTSEPRRLGLSLDSLMLQEIQENSADYQNFETESAKHKAALFRVIGDVAQAGIRIKPETFTAGDIKTRDGDFLTRITQRDVAQLRGLLAKPTREVKIGKRKRWTEQEGKVDRSSESGAPTRLRVEGVAAGAPLSQGLARNPRQAVTTIKDTAARSKTAAKQRQLGDGDFDDGAQFELGPRPAPEGRRIGRDFVPTTEVVTDVKVSPSPYEGNLIAARAVRRDASLTPAQRRDAIHAEGVKIGEAELRAQDEAGTISPKRLDAELARLRDVGSGLSRRYLNRAAKGEFDRGTPVEARARTEKMEAIDRKELAREGGGDDVQDSRIDAGAESASAPSGPHDLKAETAMLNTILDAMGVEEKVTVAPHEKGDAAGLLGGNYRRTTRRIGINDYLHGAERVEVLSHELGHHLFWNEIAKHVEGGFNALKGMSLNEGLAALESGNPKLFAALKKDFDKWNADRPSTAPTYRSMRERGKHRLFANDAEAFHEWVADNVARALTQQRKPVGIVGKFFKDVATQLRRAWKLLTAKPDLRPAPSVDAWVRGMFDANAAAVKQATGAAVSPKTADAAVRAAVVASAPTPAEAFTVANVGDLVEFIKHTLPADERQMLDRVFGRAVAIHKLREFWGQKLPDAVPMLDDAKAGVENRIALGYLAWQAGAFTTGPKGTSALTDIRDSALRLLGIAGEGELAHQVLSDISDGTIQRFHDRNRGYSVRRLAARERGTLQKAANWLAEQGPIGAALDKFWTGQQSRIRSSSVPALREVLARVQRPQGATGDQDRGMNVNIRVRTFRFHQKYAAALDGLSRLERQRVMTVLRRHAAAGAPVYDKRSAKVRRAVDELRALFAQAHAYGAADNIRLFQERRAVRNYAPVQLDVRDDKVRDRLRALYSRPYFADLIYAKFGETEKSPEQLAKLVDKMVEAAAHEAADPLQVNDEVILGVRAQKERFSDFIYDASVYETDGEGQRTKVADDPRTPEQRAADIREFAALQTKDPDEMFARYFVPLVKAVELRRQFGSPTEGGGINPRGRLDALLEQAKAQGAADEDIALAENMVKAAVGTYGADGSPVLAALSPALAKRLSGDKTKATIEGLQAYQNARLLPLAILSSLVDPMGIAVRTGGDMKTAWQGFRRGFRVLTNKDEAKRLLADLEAIGAGDDFMHAIAAQPTFDGREGGFAKRVNETVFKWNGMQTLVMATRVMAMEAGHRFLLKHAAADSDQSRRFLAELSLTPDDIRADPDAPGRAVLNDKVVRALNQFVDEAVLRPNSTQVPLWHRDPYMGLLTQYKAFAYAIHDQIGGRIAREATHGNMQVFLAALSYLPIVMAAELLREFIQYGEEGNPRRKEWGPGEYAALAVDRTGLLGPQAAVLADLRGDLERNNLPGNSQLGPTLGQAEHVADAARGRRDLGKEFEAALPGAAAWRHWNDAPAQAQAAG